ncbi:MAG: hypothetical protein BWK78_00255 [Thiotrichaceae bacterium IS1]|nr:MAG: hypothetical protein BWK78_00255 [Thiotrichaceae bacterium IS1]
MKKLLFVLQSVVILAFYMWTNSAFAIEVQFPAQILYKILIANKVMGSTKMTFTPKGREEGTYSLTLAQFQGLGFKLQDRNVTLVKKNNLSLYANFLTRGDQTIYEIRLGSGDDFGITRQAFRYKEATDKGTIDTMLYSDYRVIDLLSSFLVISEKVRGGDKQSDKFNLFIGKSTKIVDLEYVGEVKIPYQGKEVPTTALSLKYNGKEVFRFHIYQQGGVYFPVSVTIEDEKQGHIELRADNIADNIIE